MLEDIFFKNGCGKVQRFKIGLSGARSVALKRRVRHG